MVQQVEEKEGLTNQAAQVRFLFLLRPDRTNVKLLVEFSTFTMPLACWRASQAPAMMVLYSPDIMLPAHFGVHIVKRLGLGLGLGWEMEIGNWKMGSGKWI